jgi:predicted molibdopterin-dependent oxidoreductase YjgC
VPGEGNFVGSHDMRCPGPVAGYRPLSDARRRRLRRCLGCDPDPVAVGLRGHPDGVRQGQIKALYLAGEMPALPELSAWPSGRADIVAPK